MSNRKLDQLSKQLDIMTTDFANNFSKLINKFKGYSTAPELQTLEGYWDAAVGLLGKTGTVVEMVDYFIRYKDLILNENVKELLEMDFTKDIRPGTQVETTKLIVNLITNFKNCWVKATPKDQTHIKTYIKLLTTKSISIKQIYIEINNT